MRCARSRRSSWGPAYQGFVPNAPEQWRVYLLMPGITQQRGIKRPSRRLRIGLLLVFTLVAGVIVAVRIHRAAPVAVAKKHFLNSFSSGSALQMKTEEISVPIAVQALAELLEENTSAFCGCMASVVWLCSSWVQCASRRAGLFRNLWHALATEIRACAKQRR